eukprot:COSAG04_NODE_4959_length_1805_cov_1.365182_3_plen_66_part_00
MPSRLGSIHAHLAAPAGAGGAVLEEPAVEMSEREKFLMDLNGYVRDPRPACWTVRARSHPGALAD